jgi:hypothetical protein
MSTFQTRRVNLSAGLSYPQYRASSHQLAFDKLQTICSQSTKPGGQFVLGQGGIRCEGSYSTLDAVGSGGSVKIGIVQGDAYLEAEPVKRENVKIVRVLYPEVWLMVSRSALGDQSLGDLAKRAKRSGRRFTIASFSVDGQSSMNLRRYLKLLGIEAIVTIVPSDYAEGARLLREGKADAAFWVCCPRHPVIQELLQEGIVRPHNITSRGALIQHSETLSMLELPPFTLGPLQEFDFESLKTPALLVVNADVPMRTVAALTASLEKNLGDLNAGRVLQVSKPGDSFTEWVHDGAKTKEPRGLTPRASMIIAILMLIFTGLGATGPIIQSLGKLKSPGDQTPQENELKLLADDLLKRYRIFSSSAERKRS